MNETPAHGLFEVKEYEKTGKFKEEMNGEVPLAFNYPDPEDGETKAVVSLCSLFIRY